MAHKVSDRARETATITGSSDPYSLNGVVVGFEDFNTDMATNDTTFYYATSGANFEVGLGTFTDATPDTMARTAIYASTNSNNAVNWGASTIVEITGTIPARFAELLNTIEITVADSATPDIGAAQGMRVVCDGTTTITSFGTGAHKLRIVRFSGARTLTHNATTLILPAAANIVTVAGDVGIFASDASGNWRCLTYMPSANSPIAASETLKGPVELATTAEAAAGTDTARAVTAAGVAAASQFKGGQFTFDISSANGTTAVTGVGFQPKAVIFFGCVNATTKMAVGAFDAAGSGGGFYDLFAFVNDSYGAGSFIMMVDISNFTTMTLTAVGADGFTVTRAKTGSPGSATATIAYLAIR